jgi:NDP-sugar pyrophosphorylase family protein
VNYLVDVIEEHFGAGEKWQVVIRDHGEEQRIGTAAALSFLPGHPDSSFVVTNADFW